MLFIIAAVICRVFDLMANKISKRKSADFLLNFVKKKNVLKTTEQNTIADDCDQSIPSSSKKLKSNGYPKILLLCKNHRGVTNIIIILYLYEYIYYIRTSITVQK